MALWWMFYSWISQWPVSTSKYRPTFQLQRDSMNWKMTPMNDFFHPWPSTTTTPTLPPHHQVAKGECGERHSWGDVATDTYVALTDLCCLLYFSFFLSCKHSRVFLFSLVCSRDWDLGEAAWYDNHQWHVLWPPVMWGGDSALPLLPPCSGFVTITDCPSSAFLLLQNPGKEVLIYLLISLLDYWWWLDEIFFALCMRIQLSE